MPKPIKDPNNIAAEFTKFYCEMDLYEFEKQSPAKKQNLILDWLHDHGYVANLSNTLVCSQIIIQKFTEMMGKLNTPLPKESKDHLNIEKE
jgi:hypothetical protein